MSSGVIAALSIVGLTSVLIGLMFGSSLVDQSYPEFRSVSFGSCSGNPLNVIGCWVGNLGAIVYNAFAFIFGTIAFMVNVLIFNVPSAPGWIRGLFAAINGGIVLWGVATALFRGSRG